MATVKTRVISAAESDSSLSLYNLLDPAVLANPYPLFRRLRTEDPVHWDPFIHGWVITRYADVVAVLRNFLSYKPAPPETLAAMGLSSLDPIAKMMMKQMLFMDPPAHTRLRSLAAQVFAPYRVEALRWHIKDIVSSLLDKVQHKGRMDVIADLAEPLPATVTAELLGVPASDIRQLKAWSADFAEMLGNFQHHPEGVPRVLQSLQGMTNYFQSAMRESRVHQRRPNSFFIDCGDRRRPAYHRRGSRQLRAHDGWRSGDDHEPDRQWPVGFAAQSASAAGAAQ